MQTGVNNIRCALNDSLIMGRGDTLLQGYEKNASAEQEVHYVPATRFATEIDRVFSSLWTSSSRNVAKLRHYVNAALLPDSTLSVRDTRPVFRALSLVRCMHSSPENRL